MIWRQMLRIATREVSFINRDGLSKLSGRCIDYPRLTIIHSTHLSTWNDGISRAGPLKKEGTAKGGSEKKDFGPKITLIGTDENISVVNFEEGQKLAKRRNLRLVKMVDLDRKTERPVYRLMSISEYNNEFKKASKAKSQREKLITFSSRICSHDVQSKVKMMNKWLAKDCEVRVIITGDSKDMNAAEEVYKTLEGHMKETSRFLQKRQINADIRFNVKSLPGNKSSAVEEKKDLE